MLPLDEEMTSLQVFLVSTIDYYNLPYRGQPKALRLQTVSHAEAHMLGNNKSYCDHSLISGLQGTSPLGSLTYPF